jgi:PAS domain S-box-containing protein
MNVAVPKHGRAPTRLDIPDWMHRVISGMKRLVLLSSLIGVFILLPICAAAQAPTKRVLILSGSDPNFPGFSIITQGLRSVIRDGSSSRIEFIYELQEGLVKSPDSESEDQELVDYLSRKYEGKKIDLVLGMVAPRFRLLLKHNPKLFADIPKVFYDFEYEREATIRDLGPNITGVWAKLELTQTLDLALALQPESRRVVVVTGSADQDKLRRENAQASFQKYESRAEFTYLSNLTLDELKGQLAALPKNCIVIFLSVGTDRAGNTYSGPEALSFIAPTSGAPIYGNSDTLMGAGIVGGSLINFEAIGKQVGNVGLRVLAGENPKDIPSSTVPTATTFDWRELRRWGIAESALPAGSIVRYKELSVWELYKWRIIGAIALIVLQALGIVWLLLTRAKRRQAEKRSERFALLAETEHQHLDEIVANVPGIVWESRLEDGDPVPRATFVSPYLGKMLGYTAGEWLSQPGFWRSIIVDEDRDQVETTVARVLETGAEGTLQARFRTKDKREVWVESHLAAICDEEGKVVGLRGVTMDISDRRRAESALQEKQAQLAGVISSAMDAIILIDERQRVVLFNGAAEAMFGCSANEALGKPFNNFITTPFRDARQDPSSSSGHLNNTSFRIGTFASLTGRRATGDEFPVDVSISEVELNQTRFYTIILRDITERLRVQKALRERGQELSEAQRIAKIGSWEWDPTLDVVTWSEELFHIMGRDPSQPAPSYAEHSSLFSPASWERLKSAVEESLREGTPYELELEMVHADGSVRWTNARGEVLRNANGKVIKLRGTLQDIAERKRAEAALQQAVMEVSKLKNQLEEENIYLREEIKLAHNFDEIVGRSDATRYVLFKIEQVAPTGSTVLITGETGTGKELVARAIHSSSSRKDRPLVRVNCAALSPTLVESELFGHEKGSFTGATGRKIGRFELANGATIFLDEIGELPLELQSKLLRVIQDGEFERLGSSRTIKSDARIIAATNRNLKTAVEQGLFREDLWYRLNVFPITVPPLRDRKEDIPGLVEHFTRIFSKKVGKQISNISPGSLKVMQDHTWPGNVRELANVIERAVINSQGSTLRLVDHFEKPSVQDQSQVSKTLEEMEKEYILRILDSTGWRIEGRKGAAKVLGLNPSTLRTRMTKLGIQKADQSPTMASAV